MSQALEARTVTSEELVNSAIDHVEESDHEIGALISLAERAQVTQMAREIDAKRADGVQLPSKFAGVPIVN